MAINAPNDIIISDDEYTVIMDFNRATKHTFRYDAVDEEAGITNVYVKKSVFPKGPPESISVTIAKEN